MEVATHKDAQRKSKRQWAQVISREMPSGYRKRKTLYHYHCNTFPRETVKSSLLEFDSSSLSLGRVLET